MSPAQEALPSASDLEDLADVALELAEVVESDLTMPEVLEAFAAFCRHPVTVFARRLCDLVPPKGEDD